MIGIVILFVVVAAGGLSYLWLNQEMVGKVEVQNPEGDAGTALVVYHPGRGSFHPRVISGFVTGLVANGWRVGVAPASPQAPADVSGYDLLVLGSPTYWFMPSTAIRRYLRRLGDLGGQPTVTIITGLGAGGRSTAAMERQVREANGHLMKALLLYRMWPNDEENYADSKQNQALAVEMATRAASELAVTRAGWVS
jgi:hypothetical protein